MAHSIFEPRKCYKTDKKTGELVPVDYISPGQSNWDEYYIDRKLIPIVKPLPGGTDEEFIIDYKLVEEKRSIQEVLDSQADDVGLEACLKKYELTGDPGVLPGQVNATDDILDLTQLPQDDAEYFEYIHSLAAKYYSLPADLRGDLNMQDFISGVISKTIDVDSYLESKKPAPDIVEGGDK